MKKFIECNTVEELRESFFETKSRIRPFVSRIRRKSENRTSRYKRKSLSSSRREGLKLNSRRKIGESSNRLSLQTRESTRRPISKFSNVKEAIASYRRRKQK